MIKMTEKYNQPFEPADMNYINQIHTAIEFYFHYTFHSLFLKKER